MNEKTSLSNILKGNTAPSEVVKPNDFTLIPRGAGDLKTRYRPQKIEELAPTCSLTQLKNLIDDPNASQVYLFEGKTGTGKTTCARIIAKASICLSKNKADKPCLKCEACLSFEDELDVIEIDAADYNKVDNARELVKDMRYLPQILKKKIYILDEVQRFTPEAQDVLLKTLEEPPPYLLVFLCTTDKKDLKQTLIDRALTLTFNEIKPKDAQTIINQVTVGKEIDQTVKVELFKNSHGSVRALLNNIQTYLQGGELVSDESEETAEMKQIASCLMKGDWASLSSILKQPSMKKDCEQLRISLENYFRAILLNKTTPDKQIGKILQEISGTLIHQPSYTHYNMLVLKCFNAMSK